VRAHLATALELLALLVAIILGGRFGLIALLAAGSAVLALRGGRWFAGRDGDAAARWAGLGGLAIGAVALAAAWWISPTLLGVTGRAVEWTTEPVVRGSVQLTVTVMVVTLVLGLAAEMVFRRWLLDRVARVVLTQGEPRPVALAAGVLIAAVIEAAVSPAGAGPRIGTVLESAGLGAIYVTSGGRLTACLGARIAFDLGALLLQALRLTA
jgi:hypothetical protein